MNDLAINKEKPRNAMTTTNANANMIKFSNKENLLDLQGGISTKNQRNLKDKLFTQTFKVKNNNEFVSGLNIAKSVVGKGVNNSNKANSIVSGNINYANRVNYIKTDPDSESSKDEEEIKSSLKSSKLNFLPGGKTTKNSELITNTDVPGLNFAKLSKSKGSDKKFQINYEASIKPKGFSTNNSHRGVKKENTRKSEKEKKLLSDSAWGFLESDLGDKKKDEFFTKKENQIPFEYLPDIFDSLHKEEQNIRINPNYMDKQKDINEKMRAIVVNWLIEVHFRFKLFPETLFICVSILDKYLSLKAISRSKLQLLGVSCLLVACKYEEIFSPEIRDFVCILDKSYEKEDIIKMEKDLLNTLKFSVTIPSSLKFYEILAISFRLTKREFFYGKYLLELALLDYKMLKYSSSLIAATACYLSLLIFKNEKEKIIDSASFFKFINYSEDLICECAMDIFFIADNIGNSAYQAVKKKFSGKKFLEVANVRMTKE